MPWPPQRVPGAAGSTPPRVEPALRSTRCSVNIRSTGEATAAAAVACVRWDADAGPAGCSSRHGSTCTSPRNCCSASSRASWPSSPRRHPVRTLRPTRAEHQVPYWAIRTPPTCFRGSAELLGPRPRRGRPDRLVPAGHQQISMPDCRDCQRHDVVSLSMKHGSPNVSYGGRQWTSRGATESLTGSRLCASSPTGELLGGWLFFVKCYAVRSQNCSLTWPFHSPQQLLSSKHRV